MVPAMISQAKNSSRERSTTSGRKSLSFGVRQVRLNPRNVFYPPCCPASCLSHRAWQVGGARGHLPAVGGASMREPQAQQYFL